MNRLKYLKNIYLSLLYLILLIIVLTPFLVRYFSFFRRDIEELFFLVILLTLGYYFNHLYKKELVLYQDRIYNLERSKNELGKKFNDAFSYIGNINILIQEIESIFTDIKKYPENFTELNTDIKYLSERILAMVNTKRVNLRIIDLKTKLSIIEISNLRDGTKNLKDKLSNIELIDKTIFDNLTVLRSSQNNFSIKTYCIIPTELTNEQKILIEAIVNHVEMFYLISLLDIYRIKK